MESQNGGLSVRVQQAIDEQGPVVHVQGEVDILTAPELRTGLVGLEGDVVVDLTDVEFLDSTGISVLVVARKRLTRSGGSLALRNPNDTIARTIEAVGLREWIEE